MKIFLSSHGHMASGMISTLHILFGDCPDVTVFDAYVDEHSVQEKLDEFFSTVSDDEDVLLLSDIYGSSVNQVMYCHLSRPHTRLVTGINLAFLLGLMSHDCLSDEELQQLIEESRSMLKQVVLESEMESMPQQEDFF